MKLILASNSPRRKEILTDFGFEFEVKGSSFSESDEALSPEAVAKANALGKANDVFNRLLNKENALVLGADTVVFLDGKILGKPKDNLDAIKMLNSLSGKTHTVVTGYALVSIRETISGAVESKVTFNKLSEKIIGEYVATGSPLDKAGAYGIQDNFGIVKDFSGSLNNVIGLPIEEIAPLLKKALSEK